MHWTLLPEGKRSEEKDCCPKYSVHICVRAWRGSLHTSCLQAVTLWTDISVIVVVFPHLCFFFLSSIFFALCTNLGLSKRGKFAAWEHQGEPFHSPGDLCKYLCLLTLGGTSWHPNPASTAADSTWQKGYILRILWQFFCEVATTELQYRWSFIWGCLDPDPSFGSVWRETAFKICKYFVFKAIRTWLN